MSLSSIQLDAFSCLARTLSFTKAAAELHITQSALSQRIANLEDALEATLFVRDRAGLRLSPEAERLLRYCRTRDSLESDFYAGLAGKKSSSLRGAIRIGGISSIMRSVVLPSLCPLLNANPELNLQFYSRETYELPAMLQGGEVDYIVSTDSSDKDGWEKFSLGTEKNVLVQKREYSGPEIYLDHDSSDTTTLSYLRIARKSLEIKRRYLDDIYGLLDGVALGLGRAVLPLHLVKSNTRLTILQPKTIYEKEVVLHFHTQPYYPATHERILTALQTNAQKYLG